MLDVVRFSMSSGSKTGQFANCNAAEVYSTGIQYQFPVMVYSTGVQYWYTVLVYNTGVQYQCTVQALVY